MAISVFGRNRYADPEARLISDKLFYVIMSATLLFGFAVNAAEVFFLADWIAGWNPVVFFIVYLVMAVAGILINAFSRNPAVSFIGYCLVVLPIGAMLALVVPSYAFDVVRSAFAVTTLLAVVFGLLAVLYPAFFASMWRVLAVSLFIALIWALVNMVTGFLSSTMVWLDWLVVLVFCCYVGFDVSLARNRPKTLDNAVDSACGLYLDLINLFLRLLIIFGRSRD